MSQRKNGRGESMLGSPRLFDAGPEVCCSSPWRQPRLQAVDCPRTAGTQPPGAGLAQPTPGLFFKETLNKSSSAEQRIFSSIRAASKAGNTQSIPPLLNPSAREKSLAVGSCRFIQSFLREDHRLSGFCMIKLCGSFLLFVRQGRNSFYA